MKRKLLIFLGIITIFAGVFVGENVYAARTHKGGANGCNATFMGFNAWWNGLGKFMNNDCELQSTDSVRIGTEDNAPVFVWTIVLNVLHDLFTAIGYISIVMITFGGYMYITSGGDPGKSVKARKTLTSAVVGLMIVMLANVIVDTIVGMLNVDSSCTIGSGLLSNVKLPNCGTGNMDAAEGHLLGNIFSNALSAGAIMAVGFIVYGGISYITSNGSPEKTKKALRTLIFAAVGLVLVILAVVITNFVMGSVDDAIDNAVVTTIWRI